MSDWRTGRDLLVAGFCLVALAAMAFALVVLAAAYDGYIPTR